jgi:hypothetical protein
MTVLRLVVLAIWLACSAAAHAQTFPVSLAAGGRYLKTASGLPFLVVGENAQTIAQSLPLTGSSSGIANANATFYFSTRSSQGINAVWVQAICAAYNNCDNLSTTYDGLRPFSATIGSCGTTTPDCWDMSTAANSGNSAYWTRIDNMISLAAQYGVLVFLMPVGTNGCGLNGSSPQWTMQVNNHAVTTAGHTNTYDYGLFLGNRYKTFPNIIWFSGNDYMCNGTGAGTPHANDLPVLDVMQGIVASGDTHPQTIELDAGQGGYGQGSFDNADFISPTAPVNVNGLYSYNPAYALGNHAYGQTTAPAVMLEMNYEGVVSLNTHEAETTTCAFPSSSTCTYEYLLRKQLYHTMLGGANAGFITGADVTDGFCVYPGAPCAPGSWTSELNTQHFTEIGYWKSLFTTSGIPWWALVPDTGHAEVTGGYGVFRSACSGTNTCITSENYVPTATATVNGLEYVVAYLGCYASNATYGCTGSGGVTVNMAPIPNAIARWFDPTNGQYTTICSASGTACSTGSQTFKPSGVNSRGDPDWVLLVFDPPTGPQ